MYQRLIDAGPRGRLRRRRERRARVEGAPRGARAARRLARRDRGLAGRRPSGAGERARARRPGQRRGGRVLAAALGVPPSTVELVRGAGSRDKLFRLRTLDRRRSVLASARLAGPAPAGAMITPLRWDGRASGARGPDAAARRGGGARLRGLAGRGRRHPHSRRPGRPGHRRRRRLRRGAGRAREPRPRLRGLAGGSRGGHQRPRRHAPHGGEPLLGARAHARRVLAGRGRPLAALARRLLAEAQAILDEDLAANRAMGAHGATLVPEGARILTHCNAGALATAGYGTAVGVIRAAHERGSSRSSGWTRRGRSCRARGSPRGRW